MPLLEWSEDLSVGLESLDNEHKIFVRHLSTLYEAIQFGHAGDVIGPLIEDVLSYASMHFAHEEALMRDTAFPSMDEHIEAHRFLKNKLLDLQNRGLTHPSVAVYNETFAFLKNWLTHHVLVLDKALADHIKAQAAEAPISGA